MTDTESQNIDAESAALSTPGDSSPDAESAVVSVENSPTPEPRRFEDMTLIELLGNGLFKPFETLIALGQTLHPEKSESVPIYAPAYPAISRASNLPAITLPSTLEIDWRQIAPLLGMMAALLLALGGGMLLFGSRLDNPGSLSLPPGGYIMIFGAIVMGVAFGMGTDITRYPAISLPAEALVRQARSMQDFLTENGLRIMVLFTAVVFTYGAWYLNYDPTPPGDVIFTAPGVFCWLMSILSWSAFFYDGHVDLLSVFAGWSTRLREALSKPLSFRISGTLVILLAIMLAGGYYRFTNLTDFPADMTSDHVEKILDVNNILMGARPIFMSRNGGRDAFHFYFLALLKTTTGLPLDFTLLKIATGIWGMIAILLAFWAGRSIFGEDNPKFGNLVGLCTAGLIAVSYWAIMLSRLGLRIVTTTLVVTVLLAVLIRALRHNRRIDYILVGFTLGWGVYCYQSARMLPVLVVLCIPVFLALRVRSWATFRKFAVNFVAVVVISIAIFVPLAHYAVVFPQFFWSRTTGRLMGNDMTRTSLSVDQFMSGLRTYLFGDPGDQTNPGLAFTYQKSLLMFNFRGDTEWFSGTPQDMIPEMDVFAGGLLVLGLGVLVARMIRRRDPADWVLLLGILVMILPSALAVAFANVEVPSATRASGALPPAYLIAGLALAIILWEVQQIITARSIKYIIYVGVVGLFALSASANAYAYFTSSMQQYRASTNPHHQAGVIAKTFAANVGSLNNTFIMGYPYWFDKRAVGIEAGDPLWSNGVDEDNPPSPDRSIELQRWLNMIRGNMGTPYEFKPDRYILIFLHHEDVQMARVLGNLMPQGWIIPIQTFQHDRDFMIFVAPPVGCDWLTLHVGGTLPASCNAPETQPNNAYPVTTLGIGTQVAPSDLATVTPAPTATAEPGR